MQISKQVILYVIKRSSVRSALKILKDYKM